MELVKSDLEKIKSLYFAGASASEIANSLKLDISGVRSLIFGKDETGTDPTCLYQVKKNISPESLAIYIASRADVIERIMGISLDIVAKSLNKIRDNLENPDPENRVDLSVDEITKVAKTASELQKMSRLEKGEATSIVEVDYSGYSFREIQEERAKLLGEAINAEYTEIGSDDET